MLWFSIGTAGELIKIFPLLRMSSQRGLSWCALSTGQSGINFWNQWDQFRLPREQCAALVPAERDLETSAQALEWFARANLRSAKTLRKTIAAKTGGLEPDRGDAWIVHGDTLSSLVGAHFAHQLGLPLAHVEAGLRSPLLFKPFPEEICRRIVSRFARYHFAQDRTAVRNLQRSSVRGAIVCTEGNTLYDAIRFVVEDFAPSEPARQPYVVANVHRYENLASPARWRTILSVLVRAAKTRPVLLVLHPPTHEKLMREPDTRKRLEDAGVQLLPRQPFTTFISLLAGSEYVISDGGSNQEECHYLGKPCLILRDSTERVEGLDNGACVLTRFDEAIIDSFLGDPQRYRRPPVQLPTSPCEIILDTLERRDATA